MICACGAMPASRLFSSASRNLANGSLGARRIDAGSPAGCLRRSSPPCSSAASAACVASFIAFGPEPLQLLDLFSAHRRIVDLQDVDHRLMSLGSKRLTPINHSAQPTVDASLRARRGFRNPQAVGMPASMAFAMPPMVLDLVDMLPRPWPQGQPSAVRGNDCRPTGR